MIPLCDSQVVFQSYLYLMLVSRTPGDLAERASKIRKSGVAAGDQKLQQCVSRIMSGHRAHNAVANLSTCLTPLSYLFRRLSTVVASKKISKRGARSASPPALHGPRGAIATQRYRFFSNKRMHRRRFGHVRTTLRWQFLVLRCLRL